jgi:hypothetical protein
MSQLVYMNVASICSKCFSCFRWMLHVFYLAVAYTHFMLQVFHPDVAYVFTHMATHVFSSCFKHMLQVFQLFRTYVTNVFFRCCKSRYDVAHVAVDPICKLYACGCGESANVKHWKTVQAQIEIERAWDTKTDMGPT